MAEHKPPLKVVIVHDWLYGGGAERVVYELHQMFPEAPIYTSYCSDEWRAKLDDKVVTGYLQHWPFSSLRKFLPALRQRWFRHLDLSDFDLVISSSGNGEAKFVRVKKPALHVCYCHSPTHFYWRHYDQYAKEPGFGMLNPLARFGLKLLVSPLKRRDYEAAQAVDYFIANSSHIQTDIKKFYRRDSVVINPPIDVKRFEIQNPKAEIRSGFVTMGRQVPYKRNDIIVEACTKLHLPLKVIGRGPDHDRLVKLAGPSVQFLTNVTDGAMPAQLATAEAFLFAAYEDFGVSPIEALAAGTPVIAYEAGGALDYVTSETGLFFEHQTVESLVATLQKFPEKKFDHAKIAERVQQFSDKHFREHMRKFLESLSSQA